MTEKEQSKNKEASKPVDELTQLKTELELAGKENEELRGQNDQLREAVQKLYQENQTLRAAHKAVAALL